MLSLVAEQMLPTHAGAVRPHSCIVVPGTRPALCVLPPRLAQAACHVQDTDTPDMTVLKQDMMALLLGYHERTMRLEQMQAKQSLAIQVQTDSV